MATLTPETVVDLSLESVVIEVLFHGIYTAVVIVTLWNLCFGGKGVKHRRPMIFLTVLMYLLSTTHIGLSWWMIRHAIIVKGSTQLSAALEFTAFTTIWFRVSVATMVAVNTLLADCTLIWRCWVIWGKNWKAILLPVLVTAVGTAFSIISLWQKGQTNPPPALVIRYGTTYFAASLATTGLVTLMIVYRILRLSGPIQVIQNGIPMNLGMRRNRYFNVIEIVVESAALYFINLLIFLVLLVRNNPLYFYPEQIMGVMTGLAPCLIVARVSLGLARPADSWASNSISAVTGSLHFAAGQATVDLSIGSHSDSYPTNRGSNIVPQPSSTERESSRGSPSDSLRDVEKISSKKDGAMIV